MACIEIIRNHETLASANHPDETQLLYRGAYLPGDEIRILSDTSYAIVQVDQAVPPARVYLPEKGMTYRIPLEGDSPSAYPPDAFHGECHLISIMPDPHPGYRNLARNPVDQRGEVQAYPHATANVETRGESVFAARNTIDGLHIADGHGVWPYGSWGIGTRTDAALTLDFGREVEIDRVVLYLRADFPHDAWWKQGTLVFSDGDTVTFPLVRKNGGQEIRTGKRHISWLRLENLLKAETSDSAFPALRQIEVYGSDTGFCLQDAFL